MKLCNKCGTVSDDFASNRHKPDGLQAHCRPCVKIYSRERFQNKKALRMAQSKALRIANMERLAEYKQQQCCVDCGCADWRVLEFDHLRDKTGNISDLAQKYSWERLLTEIVKCEIVCANCHRIRTLERRQGVG